MKKVFYFFAVAVLALSITSCNKDKVTYNYSLELSAVYNTETNQPEITATLSEEGAAFIIAPYEQEVLTNTNAQEADIFAALMEVYGSKINDYVHTKSGVYTFPSMSWVPNKTYTIVGFVVDVNTLSQLSKMASADVVIPQKSNNQISMMHDGDSTLYITTTTKDKYYVTLTTEEIYLRDIESGNTTIAQFVSEAFKADVDTAKAYSENSSYTEIAEKYLLAGSQKFNFVEEYGIIPAGTYYALAAGIEYTDNLINIEAQPTTEGVAVKFTLDKDYILSAPARAQIRGRNNQLIMKRNLNFRVDRKKMFRSTLK